MKAQSWQKLLKEKGWLQGDHLVIPAGYTLYFVFNLSSLCGSIKHDQVTEITEEWIAAILPKVRFVESTPCLCYHLWEDISEIKLIPNNAEEANLLLRPADKRSAGP